MAKKNALRRILATALALIMCFGIFGITVSAAGGRPNGNQGNTSSKEYEWYKVYINGNLAASDQGSAGNHTWLVQGVYSWDVSVSGTTLTWKAGAHKGTIDLTQYIDIPEGYEVREEGCVIEHSEVTGENSQSAQFDNATITVVIHVLYDEETGEEIPVETKPQETEPEVTEPEITEPEVTEPEVTEPEVTEPEVTEPEVTEPEVTEPEVTEPEVTEPEITEPEVTEPEVTEPEVTEPEVTEPEVTEPEVTEPDPNPQDDDYPLVEIPDEDVPLAEIPKTGDPMILYGALTALSGMGLAALSFKKKED